MPTEDPPRRLTLSKPRRGIRAYGYPVPGGRGFVLCAGAVLVKQTRPSFPTRIRAIREALREEGAIEDTGAVLRLTRDHTFASSSAAAAFVLGVSANGKHNWKREEES